MPIYLLVKSFIKKAIEKRSYYSDTPGKFALLKELKRNFLQIFVVDSSCFCNFVAENERFNQRFNQRKIIPSVFVTFLFVLSLFLSWLYLFLYSGCGISEMYLARCWNAYIYRQSCSPVSTCRRRLSGFRSAHSFSCSCLFFVRGRHPRLSAAAIKK